MIDNQQHELGASRAGLPPASGVGESVQSSPVTSTSTLAAARDSSSSPDTFAASPGLEDQAAKDNSAPATSNDAIKAREAGSFDGAKVAVKGDGSEKDGSGNNTTTVSEKAFGPDPMDLDRHRLSDVSEAEMKLRYPKGNAKKLSQFYSKQNELIGAFLNSGDEESQAMVEMETMGPKIKFAINASFAVNCFLFIIQVYAAVSTGSLALFATAADAFMDLVSSAVMFITSRLAQKPSLYNYPVGRTRIETIGVILFCALMTTVAVQLIVEAVRSLASHSHSDAVLQIIPLVCVCVAIGAKGTMCVYCFFLRKYPSVHVFFIDHRNDIAVNGFGLIMSFVGAGTGTWWADPTGALCIGLLILCSWIKNAFDQVFLLVGRSAPKEFLSKVTYVSLTHDDHIIKVDTVRAYHAGQKYYVEVDIIMDETESLKKTHDVGQSLQRKLEGLEDVERAFVHVDYDDTHDVNNEHKPLFTTPVRRRAVATVIGDAGRKVLATFSRN